LTDLTRMLLSSPHFSSFLNDLSVNGLPPQLQALHPQPQPQPQPHPQHQLHHPSQQLPVVSSASIQPGNRSDLSPTGGAHEFHAQQNFHVGMTLVPEQGLEMAAMDVHGPGWNSGIDMNYNNVPVFAVLAVPDGPAVDVGMLSGKTSDLRLPISEMKDEAPCLDLPPALEKRPKRKTMPPKVDKPDSSLALFDAPLPAPRISPDPFMDIFGAIETEKAFAHYELIIKDESTEINTSTVHRFKQLCFSMEAAFQRVSRVTSHLL
jgi:bZIP-type transcription factor MBZ1